jgi:hypothetical protein
MAGKPLPAFRNYFDLVGDILLVMARAAFGAIGGVIFHTQLTGAATAGAIAVGASAPILLRQLGQIHAISDVLAGASQSLGSEPPDVTAGEDADRAATHA